MEALNGYDYAVLIVYMTTLVGIGVYFARYMTSAGDYFKAANKLTWWVAGLSSFMSAFSAWMFTGGAGIVYREGLTGMVALAMPGVAIFTGYLLFAKLWRRSRVTTITGYLEERFNLSTHQMASWAYIPFYILYSGTALYAMAIFISVALQLDIKIVVWTSGLVILAYTLLGGVWAVSVNDSIQFLILLPICLLLVPLALISAGGPAELVRSAPPDFFHVPSKGMPWHYLVAYLVILIHGQNTNPIAQRYFSVKNEVEARRVSLLCSGLFVVGLLFWAVPPMVARVLYPDLGSMINLPNPDEGAFVVIAMRLLPHGLLGLLVAAMFAASLSSLDSVYNLLAGIVAKDVYQRLFNRELSDKGLLRVGQIATLAIGLVVIWLTLAMLEYGQGSFYVMMKVSSLTGTPLATPMLLGFLYRKAPSWACMFSFLCSISLACVFAFYPPLGEYLQAQGPWVEFSVSSLSIVTVGVVSFMISPWLFKSSAAAKARIENFYLKLDTPVDESAEIVAGDIDKTSIARFVGRIAFMLGGMVAVFLLIPNSLRDHIVTLCVSLGLLAFGLWLTMVARRERRAGGA